MVWLPDGEKNVKDVFINFDRLHERGRPTDGQTDTAWRHSPRLCLASRGNNQQTCKEKLYQQELSYRKQITRKLRTQYVEGI